MKSFRSNLYEDIKKNFMLQWDESELDSNLAFLEVSKMKCGDENATWRPTDQTPEDQTRPFMHKFLLKKKKVIQRQLDHQNSVIEEMIPQVGQSRKRINEQSEKRKEIVEEIIRGEENLKKVEEKINVVSKNLNSNQK